MGVPADLNTVLLQFTELRPTQHGRRRQHHVGRKRATATERAGDAGSTPGPGLGLYISRQIAREHGGSISVRSELGQGSVFELQLPLAA